MDVPQTTGAVVVGAVAILVLMRVGFRGVAMGG